MDEGQKKLEEITELEYIEKIESMINETEDDLHNIISIYKQYLRDKTRYQIKHYIQDDNIYTYKKIDTLNKKIGYNRDKK